MRLSEPIRRHRLEQRMDELARQYHETHDAQIKAEIEAHSRLIASEPEEDDDPDCE